MNTERFGDSEEEKRYWDSFDAADLRDDEEIKIHVKKPLRHILTIRVDEADLKKLQTLAAIQGMGVMTYARGLLKAVL